MEILIKLACMSISEFTGPMQSIRGSGKLGLESEFQPQDSRVPLTIGIQNPSSTDEEYESSFWNPRSIAWNSESKTVLGEGGQNENQLG